MAKIDPALYLPFEQKFRQIIFTEHRRYFFIEGPRETGKTYTGQKVLLEWCIKNNRELGYLFRTRDEMEDNGAIDALTKCLENEFPDIAFIGKGKDIYIGDMDDKGVIKNQKLLVRGFALAQAKKRNKKKPVPKVDFLIFDEFMLEKEEESAYIHGFNEPDWLISLAQSIDRGEDRLKIILFGNNTTYYNPYHLHPVFEKLFMGIPEKGEIRRTPTALFWRYEPTPELREAILKTQFAQSFEGTAYGDYAIDGEYQDDVVGVKKLPAGAKCKFGLRCEGQTLYVHEGYNEDLRTLWLSEKGDKELSVYAVRGNDITPDIEDFRNSEWYTVFNFFYNKGRVLFSDQKTKAQSQSFLYRLLSNFRKN